MGDRRCIELTRSGFDTAPFQPHPVGVYIGLLHEGNIFIDTIPMVVGDITVGSVGDAVFLAAPPVPAVIRIAAFDLNGGGGNTEEKVVRKMKRLHESVLLSAFCEYRNIYEPA